MLEIKKLTDKNKQQYYPITHVDAVIGIDGRTIAEILDEDYATKGDIPTKTSDLTNDGDGSDSNSPFATQKYVSENGSKIDIVKVDGAPLEIDQTDKSVDIVGKLDSNFVKVNSKGVQVLYHVNDDGTFTTNDNNKRQLIDAEEGYYYKLEELSGGPHRVNFLTSSEYEAGGIVPLVDGYEANTIVLKRGYTYFITPIGTKYISIDCGDSRHFKIWKFDSKDLSEFALKNDLSDYATKEYVAEYGGKIDKITVDGTELPIVDKTVDIPSYDDAELRDLIATNSTAIAAEITRATARENTIDQKFGSYIPTSEKGSNNGVATLNNNGRVSEGQLQFPTRGQIPSNIDDTNLDNGIYNVNGKVISNKILNGEQANGVFIQYPYASKVQQLIVGRAANASGGEQVETYTRRYLSTPQRWTQWNSGGGVPSSLTYALSRSGDTISLSGSDASVSSVDVENTTYGLMMRGDQIVLYGSDGYEAAVSYDKLSLYDTYSGDTSSGTSIGKLISQDVVVKSRMALVNYIQIVGLRNEGKLSPGLQYRITDYSTVVNQRYCYSAGHNFDIIVTADDERTLNENARAIRRQTDDGYFANSNLSAWELKYSLDNDSTKYGWASPSGKGVIYFMRDEHGNECPYDFKNVIYEFDVENSSGGTETLSGYTFTSFNYTGSEWATVDATVSGTRGDSGENIQRYNNVVRVFSDVYDTCHFLNRICVYGMPRTSCHWGTLQVVFDSGCHDIFIGGCNPFTNNSEEISKIKVGCSSSSIILPRVSYYLNIGNFCYNITQSSQGGTLTDLTIGDYGSHMNFGLMSLDEVEIGAHCYAIRGSGHWSKLTLGGWNNNLNLNSSTVYNVTIDKFISNKTIEPSDGYKTYETVYQAANRQIITI